MIFIAFGPMTDYFFIATGVWSSLKPLEFKGIIEMLQYIWLIQNIADYELHSVLSHDLEYHTVTNLGNWLQIISCIDKQFYNKALEWWLYSLRISSIVNVTRRVSVNTLYLSTLKLPFPLMSSIRNAWYIRCQASYTGNSKYILSVAEQFYCLSKSVTFIFVLIFPLCLSMWIFLLT